MAGHIYSEIYLHMNWHVEKDFPVLTGEVERYVHQHIKNRFAETKGVYFFDINGDDRHIHLVVRIEPHVNISELIGGLKGSSSHDTNERFRQKILSWQRGYGVVSFGKRNMEWVLDYVRNQREHHAKGTMHPRMEACSEEQDVSEVSSSVVREEEAGYFRRDRGAEQKAYQADTPLWSNEEHGEKTQVLVSRLVQRDTRASTTPERSTV